MKDYTKEIGFWKRLESFVSDVQTNCCMGEEEKQMILHNCKLKILDMQRVSNSLPNYEYEMLIDDEGTPFEINSWIPITTDRIKDPSRIDEYIAKGLMRKRQ